MIDFDQEIDVSGMKCPMPVLRAKKALLGMAPDQVLHIIATEPISDITIFVDQMNNELLEETKDGDEFHYLIRKN